jgi:hypothetical protein
LWLVIHLVHSPSLLHTMIGHMEKPYVTKVLSSEEMYRLDPGATSRVPAQSGVGRCKNSRQKAMVGSPFCALDSAGKGGTCVCKIPDKRWGLSVSVDAKQVAAQRLARERGRRTRRVEYLERKPFPGQPERVDHEVCEERKVAGLGSACGEDAEHRFSKGRVVAWDDEQGCLSHGLLLDDRHHWAPQFPLGENVGHLVGVLQARQGVQAKDAVEKRLKDGKVKDKLEQLIVLYSNRRRSLHLPVCVDNPFEPPGKPPRAHVLTLLTAESGAL